MIITVGHTKGGVGKTTVAANLAVCYALDGKKVMMVDADVQSSLMSFRAVRSSNDLLSVSILEPILHVDLQKYEAVFDVVIVDCGGRDASVFRSAISAAAVFLAPFVPSQIDVWSNSDLLKILKEVKVLRPEIQVYMLLNMMQPRTTLAREVKEAIRGYPEDCRVLDSFLCHRVAYKTSFAVGKGVVEYTDPSAAREMRNLYEEVNARAGTR